ncbi:hypothetical protein EYF80_040228 [Liparis tanakae]|uniref:Uncharacterized protein n=1 Tax=Liparis tanakae TaxID=230148 RepID=A0A4Z2G9C0_9TELE|nr:hypothetical protein EYF80_040228 [Liparis tanakae]
MRERVDELEMRWRRGAIEAEFNPMAEAQAHRSPPVTGVKEERWSTTATRQTTDTQPRSEERKDVLSSGKEALVGWFLHQVY